MEETFMQNKLVKRFSIAAILLLCLMLMVGCTIDDNSTTAAASASIESVAGIRETYYQNQELDFSDVVVTVKNAEGQVEEIPYGTEGLSISLDVSAVNAEAEVVVTYGELEHKVSVAVAAIENATALEYVSGIETGVTGEEQDFSAVLVKVTFANGDEIFVKYNEDFDIDVVEDNAENKAVATITLGGVSCDVEFSLIRYYVNGIIDPQFWSDYQMNIGLKDNKRQEFKNRENPYLVGSMNGFIFSPKVKAFDYGNLDEDGEPIMITLDRSAVWAKVYLLSEGEWVLLEGDALAEYVTVDEDNASFQFTAAAEGQSFKLSVLSKLVTAGQLEDYGEEAYTVSVEVSVIDGYNCYTAADLALFDNRSIAKSSSLSADIKRPLYDVLAEAWNELRLANGITVNPDDVAALILHANVSVTVNDIPRELIYQADDEDIDGYNDESYVIGSMRDEVDIYYRLVDALEEESFSFYGNYFTIDAQQLPLIMREGLEGFSGGVNTNRKNGEYIISHTTVFCVQANNAGKQEGKSGHFVFDSANLTGNLNKTETKLSGGMMLFKPRAISAELSNLIADRWFITSFGDDNTLDYHVEFVESKFYDNYNSMLFLANGTAFIRDCEMIGAGGPVIILDHWWDGDINASTKIPQVFVDSKSHLESWVAGSEGWFTMMGATAVTQLLPSLNDGLKQYGSAFMHERDEALMMNAVVVLKKGGQYSVGPSQSRGKYYVFNGDDLDAYVEALQAGTLDYTLVKHCMDTDEASTKAGLTGLRAIAPGGHIFQGSIPQGMAALTKFNGQQLFGYYDYSLNKLVPYHDTFAQYILPSVGLSAYPAYAPAFLQGPCLNIYIYGGLGVVIDGYVRV